MDRVSVKAEAIGALDCDIKNFADAISRRLKDDDFVRSGAPHQTRSVCFAWTFTQNFDASSHQSFIRATSRGIDNSEQILIARLFCCLLDLIRHEEYL